MLIKVLISIIGVVLKSIKYMSSYLRIVNLDSYCKYEHFITGFVHVLLYADYADLTLCCTTHDL